MRQELSGEIILGVRLGIVTANLTPIAVWGTGYSLFDQLQVMFGLGGVGGLGAHDTD